MRAKALVNRINSREYLPIILLAGAYLFFYYPAIFGQHANVTEKIVTLGNIKSETAPEPQAEEWQTLKSVYFTIYYRPTANLKAIERKLKKRGGFYIRSASRPKPQGGTEGKVAYRMDLLFQRAKDILAMYPRIKNIQVKIFKNRSELNTEYYKIFGSKKNFKSFFIYKYNTIYISEEDIFDSVIAHEMGHAIVDHYFVVRPPEKVRELLAQYVDLHLMD